MRLMISGQAVGVFGTPLYQDDSIIVDLASDDFKIEHAGNQVYVQQGLWRVVLRKPLRIDLLPESDEK